MRILVISDKESKSLWDYYDKKKLEQVELIISCGDLHPHYLSFLVTMTNVPLLYVHGNHDEVYDKMEPEGCICIDDKIYVHKGLRILGLGGSMLYNGGKYQYSEKQMRERVRKLWFPLWKHKGFDLLVTHAPAYTMGDGEDLPHRGFQVFLELIEKYRPRYFLHGHMHLNYRYGQKREIQYKDTMIINGYESYIFSIKD